LGSNNHRSPLSKSESIYLSRGGSILLSDIDRQDSVKNLAETGQKTGCQAIIQK
jgi:hypothetical protein